MRSLRTYVDELKSLDQHNIGSWPLWAYGVVMGVVALVVIFIAGWYFVLPKRADVERAEQHEIELRERYASRAAQVANLAAYRAQLADMRADFATLLDQLPSQTEVPSLLRDISAARAANGLNEQLFKPAPEIKRAFYAELPNELVVTGGYHAFGRFVSDVAALSRIVTLNNVQIAPVTPPTSEADGDGPLLRMSLTATTYRYLEPDERETAPANAKAKTR